MLKHHLKPQKIAKGFVRCCSVVTELKECVRRDREKKVRNVKVFIEVFGLDYAYAYRYATKYDFREIDPVEAKRTFEVLTKHTISKDAIQEKPTILTNPATSLRNRCEILTESGFTSLSIPILTKYLSYYKKPVSMLKTYSVLPPYVDVVKKLAESFQVEPKTEFGDEASLEVLRVEMLSQYLMQNLGFSEDRVQKFWKAYGRTRHKSAKSILDMVNILKNDLNFTDEKIQGNAFVLHADPENVTNMLYELRTVNGIDTRTLMFRRPKTMMTSVECLQKIASHLELFNISGESLALCPDILTLSPDTVLERLRDLKSVKEFDALFGNPRILKLVHYQKKARARLESMQLLKLKNTSIQILSSDNASFEKHALEGADKTGGADTLTYLANRCEKTKVEVRKYLARHPHWKSIPLTVVKDNFELLRRYNFRPTTIYQNVHLLLYPTKKITETLNYIRNETEYNDANPIQLLSLTLYHIEFDHHFTGDGVWTDEHNRAPDAKTETTAPTDVENFGDKKKYRKTVNQDQQSL